MEMTTVSVKSIKSSYGTTKRPQLLRISELLASCPNLQVRLRILRVFKNLTLQ